ncbi:hypothetical protein [Paenibacillus naphthalenovorans]
MAKPESFGIKTYGKREWSSMPRQLLRFLNIKGTVCGRSLAL